ncbi:hypothetical protein LT330_010451 [Penicillium expansum]|uniref:Antifungal protein n=1 Tax=Penicillium expansum TaxID=27334 RepID=A0A0A2K8K6_PENEN|nr:Antifungal protein [Penicillium expansum]KAJ5506749.1 Antifungal protein [Penicillium expansum]KAK4863845.1 hypothetical protein LT330_010451 [Penicillium expansum]KGO45316.1 Antifungal protein [Penicillium expansum]KGO63201.1 Antifungal protein [Penicillium expansum]KGO66933.1 Antifungal protein [Penicillium expansum]
MQITKIALFLFAAMGAVASPIEAEAESGINARAENGANVLYTGQCFKKDNICKYKVNGKQNIAKCPSAANKRCEKDKNKCTFDSYDRKVTCDFRK